MQTPRFRQLGLILIVAISTIPLWWFFGPKFSPEQQQETPRIKNEPASNSLSVERLGPDQVAAVNSLWQQLADIDDSESDEFKEPAWKTVGGWLHEYLQRGQDLEALAADPFVCLPDQDKFELEAARKCLRSEGPKMIQIRLSLVEAVRVLHAARPGLVLLIDGWKRGGHPDSLKASTAAILDALRSRHLNRQRLAKLRLLAGQQEWLLQMLSLDRGELVQLANALDPLGAPEALAGIDNPDKVSALLHQRKQAAQKAHELEPRLRAFGESLHGWFDQNARGLALAERTYREIASIQVIDLPSDALAKGRAFVRCRLSPPERAEYKGTETPLTARLSLAWPAANNSAKLQSGIPAHEEVPLGLEVTGVQLRFDEATGKVAGVRAEPTQLRANVKLADPAALRRALVRLGIPEVIQLTRLEAIPNTDLTLIRIRFEAELPTLGVKTSSSFEVVIDLLKGKVVVDPHDPAAWLTEGEYFVNRLRNEFAAALKGKRFTIGNIVVSDLNFGGKWTAGEVVMTAKAEIPGLPPWPLRLEYLPPRPEQPARLRIVDAPVPVAIVDEIATKARDKLLAELAPLIPSEPRLPLGIEEIGRFVRVTDPKFDADKARIEGRLVIATKVKGADVSLSAQFSVNLVDGSVSVAAADLLKQLAKVARDLLVEAAERRAGDAVAELAGRIKGKSLDILGARFTVTVATYEASTASFLVNGTLTLGGETITFTGLRLCSIKIEGERVVAPKLDFTGTKVRPSLTEYVGRKIGLDGKFVRLSQERWLAEGVEFELTLILDGAGIEIPLGLLKLGSQGVAAELDTKRIIQATAEWLVKQTDLKIPDIGPVRNIKPDLNRLNVKQGQLELWVTAECALAEGVVLPLEGRLSPTLEIKPGGLDKVLGELSGKLAAALGLPDALPVYNLKPLMNPVGLQLDARIGLFGDIGVTLPGIRILRDRVVFPERASIQVPGFIPIPPALAIVNPGIGFSLGNDPKGSQFEVLGNITFLSEGIDKIIKIRCRLTFGMRSVKDLNVDLNGTLILVEFLPVFEVNGKAELTKGRLALDARTVGLIDKIIQVRGQHRIDGPELLATQYGTLAVLGLDLLATDILIDAKVPEVRAEARTRLPLCEAMLRVNAAPDLKKVRAEASLEFKILGFAIGGASLKAQPALAELLFKVLGFRIRVITPGVSALTPGVVIDVIESLLDFDPAAFLKALAKREITVSLLKDDGEPVEGEPVVGQGDKLPPPPPGSRGEKERLSPPPSSLEQATKNPTSPPPMGGNPPGPMTDTPRGHPPGSVQPTPAPIQGGGQVPRSVYAYRPGPNVLEFVDDPNQERNPGMYVDLLRNSDGKTKWIGMYAFPNAVKEEIWDNHLLKRDIVLIDEYWTRLVDKDGRPTSLPSRSGPHFDLMHVFVTIDSNRQVYVVEFNPAAGRKRVRPVNVPWKDINPQLIEGDQASWWDKIRTWFQKNKEDLLQPGDIRMVREYVRMALLPGGPQIESISRQSEEKGGDHDLSHPEGFFYKVKNPFTTQPTLAFCERKTGWVRFEAVPGTDLYELVKDYPGSALAKNTVLLHCGPIGNQIRILWRGDGQALLLMTKFFPTADSEDYLWRASATGLRRFGVSKVDLPIRAVATAQWPPSDLLGKSLSDLLNGPDWDEIALTDRLGVRAVGLGRQLDRQLDKPDWGLLLLSETRQAVGATRLESVGQKANGAAIETRFKTWATDSRVKPSAPHRSLDAAVSRRWVLNILLSDREVWDRYFEANPRGLLLP